MLLERAGDLARLDAAVDGAREGNGKFVIVRGEAGIGKTSLLGEFTYRQEDDCQVLSGACSHLATPMPLEPFWDMTDFESGIEAALTSHDVQGLYRELHAMFDRRTRPTVLIIDDIHWSDQATLDIVRRLGRRIGELHGVLVVSFRDEEVVLDHPLQRVVGELPPASTVHIKLLPLTEESVSKMAGDVDARAIWERTGGNPLLVTETIRSGEDVPEAITQQVLARLGRLDEGSRALIELVSLVPGSCERAVVDDLMHPSGADLAEAEQSGLLVITPGRLAFRHELIRRAVERTLPAGTRISLNSDLHDALEARGAEVTRLVHHAIEGGDDEALLRSVPRAVEIAVSVGSYREARRHLMSIEHLLGHLDDLQRAALLNTWATAEDALGNIGKAMELRLRAIELYETAGSKTRLAECVQRLPVLQARMKLPEAARETAALAVELARSSGNPNVLSRALSDFAEIHAMHRYMGESRVAIAEALDVANDDMTRAYALAMELWTMASGAMALQKIPEALALARRSGSLLAERVIHVVRVLCCCVEAAPAQEKAIEDALRFSEEVEIDDVRAFALLSRARMLLRHGHLIEAEDDARDVMQIWENPNENMAVHSLATVGIAQLRRGAPTGLETMRTAVAVAEVSPFSNPVVHFDLAQAHWLDDRVPLDPRQAVWDARPTAYNEPDLDYLVFWPWLLGIDIGDLGHRLTKPEQLLIDGDWRGSAAGFAALNLPFEQAVALSRGDTAGQLEALGVLDEIGAAGLASRIRRSLRNQGVTGVPAGPRRSTRIHPAGLTDRQAEMLALLADGLTNAEAADRLFISTRTAEHHVAAIISKLGVHSREEAVEVARERRLLESSTN